MKETKDSKTNDRSKTTIIGKIIAFASVFEQLSSSETPYNNIKKLSEVLKIMQAQKNSGILDADLYNIFIKNEIYIDYAKEYLDPSQIDEINIEEIL
jgi:HD-GYP domain-containing protein (c-di-GMP phosphodiesterase class II)